MSAAAAAAICITRALTRHTYFAKKIELKKKKQKNNQNVVYKFLHNFGLYVRQPNLLYSCCTHTHLVPPKSASSEMIIANNN